tara:strand:+ start:801 stop:1115 length:315 start_codon:yes stop_codon:yes gene_type:complete
VAVSALRVWSLLLRASWRACYLKGLPGHFAESFPLYFVPGVANDGKSIYIVHGRHASSHRVERHPSFTAETIFNLSPNDVGIIAGQAKPKAARNRHAYRGLEGD